MISLVEQATINFYQWESRGRGYYLFNHPIELEPPYIPFEHVSLSQSPYYDDGKVTLLGRLKTLLGDDTKEQEDEVEEILPIAINPQPKLLCLRISFPKGFEVSLTSMNELLKLLHFSDNSFSFEILAQYGTIDIQFTAHKNDIQRLESHLKAFFPQVIIHLKEALDINFDFERTVAIADFGLDSEFMLPISSTH
jgi:hypothetical protein